MKTEVLMQRELFGSIVHQQSKSTFISSTDLVRAGNKWRIENGIESFNVTGWLGYKHTKEFIRELTNRFGIVYKPGTGRGNHSWMHPFLAIDLALAINSSFKVEVYSWLYDQLLAYRNDSGDSYKRMSGALYQNTTNKSTFQDGIRKTALLVQKACGVEGPFKDEDVWEKATQEQLKMRDKIHDNIALLCDVLRDNNQAIKLGIAKSLE